MRMILTAVLGFALALPAAAADKDAPGNLESDDQQAIYALGATLAQMVQQYDLSPDEVDILIDGLRDGLLGKELKVDLTKAQARLRSLGQARQARVAAREEAAGKAFLEQAATHKGAERTESGLVIETIQEGSGESPGPHDTVRVHYTGRLRDGTVFDSSVKRGSPATFPLDQVIPCWAEGLQKMKVGGTAKLYCPASLAYGSRGAPPKIKPGAALVFEVELLGIPDKKSGEDGGGDQK